MPTRVRRAKGTKADDSGDSIVTTTIRITRRQWAALHRAAMGLATERGSGRPDASEVLRDVLDGWLASQR